MILNCAGDMATVGEHAIVPGATMAGLLAARVLGDFYKAVTVVERDTLDDAEVFEQFVKVAWLVDSPTRLLRPSVIGRVALAHYDKRHRDQVINTATTARLAGAVQGGACNG